MTWLHAKSRSSPVVAEYQTARYRTLARLGVHAGRRWRDAQEGLSASRHQSLQHHDRPSQQLTWSISGLTRALDSTLPRASHLLGTPIT